jgi:iron complex transport system substrate-binding protein
MTGRANLMRDLPYGFAATVLSVIALLASAPVQAADTVQHVVSVTDIAGRQVRVRAPVQRVLLGEGRQVYLTALLDRDDPIKRVVGWRNDLIRADPDTYAQYRRKFPNIARIPSFGGFEDGTFDVEQALTLRPDVVFLNIEAQRATAEARYIEKLGALGIPVVYVDFRHRPMENTEATVRLFGTLFGEETRAEAFIAFRAAQFRRVRDVIAARRPAPPNVFVERAGGFAKDCCLTFGAENFGAIVEMAGGRNIARDLLPGTFGQLNPEQVLAVDPAHVIITSARWEAYVPGGDWIGVGPGADLAAARRKLEGFTKRPAYAGIAANTNRNFHAIWHQFYNSPYQFVALQQIAVWLHPELFADLNPDQTFREFHERFLPVAYEPGYFVSLRSP